MVNSVDCGENSCHNLDFVLTRGLIRLFRDESISIFTEKRYVHVMNRNCLWNSETDKTVRPSSSDLSGISRISITLNENSIKLERMMTYRINLYFYLRSNDRMRGYRIPNEELLLVQLLWIQQIIRWLTFIMKTESCSSITGRQQYQNT